MAYGDFKDFPRRTDSDKVLHDKSFGMTKNSNCRGYQHGLASVVYKFFVKKSLGGAVTCARSGTLAMQDKCSTKSEIRELHKPIIGKFEKCKVHSSFKDNIWGADVADMKLISKCNKLFNVYYV